MLKILRGFFASYKYQASKLFFSVIPRAKGEFFKFEKGLNLIGFYDEGMGLGQALRNAAGALLAVNIDFVVRKLYFRLTSNQANPSMQPYLNKYCIYRYNLICINPDFLYRLPIILRPGEWMTPFNIGYWFWEMPDFPKSWHYALSLVDEIWVSSDFTLTTMKKITNNVFKIPFAVEFNVGVIKYTKSYFGFPEDAFIFLYCFDFNSSYWRKNPVAVINAFKKAFPDPNKESIQLLIKVSNVSSNIKQFFDLKEVINLDPRITLKQDDYDRDQLQGLLNAVDCYVSLHRAEGLGLIMAESMYLGKPVIATGYSGNLEFMNEQNSCLVPYDLIPVSPGEYSESEGQYWAEPNVEIAANYMKKIASDKSFSRSLGESAALHIRENHSFVKMGQAIQDRLQVLEGKSGSHRLSSQ